MASPFEVAPSLAWDEDGRDDRVDGAGQNVIPLGEQSRRGSWMRNTGGGSDGEVRLCLVVGKLADDPFEE
jgi:hypothetical protein